MKKIAAILLLSLLVFASCTSVKSTVSGKDNEAYLEFIGKPSDFEGGVSVDIDGSINFIAQVCAVRTVDRLDGKIYAIPTGSHIITVSFKNNIIYKQKIFISNQETRFIKL